MRKMLFAVLTTLLSAMFFACTAAPQIESGSVALENKDIKAVMIFSSGDREKISHYYKSRKKQKHCRLVWLKRRNCRLDCRSIFKNMMHSHQVLKEKTPAGS